MSDPQDDTACVITCTPAPPITPPKTVRICVPKKGTLTLVWGDGPATEREFDDDADLCFDLEIPAGCQGLVLEFPGCPALNVV